MMNDRSPFRITVTPRAKDALLGVLRAHERGFAVRLFVLPGAQPRPNMAVERPRSHEKVLEVEGVPLVVDDTSRKYLAESTIDYVVEEGYAGFHLEGPNLPSTPPGALAAPTGDLKEARTEAASGLEKRETPTAEADGLLKRSLQQIFDPEIPMNIWDLGLIYGIDWPAAGKVHVKMTMTSPGCPVGEMLRDQVLAAARAVPGVREADVEIVWEPPWGPQKMSDFAKRQFGYA
ncbi:MAG: DUF59 domain-containing protein [Euryarchaeota archaeon]|nr:DUF59 domain-containing protein [Euryarchaeota archaeon]MDE1837883.1 DUF59 domain-containing protein [Euryarchaeota archaeon]MDE1881646.1 DUF59 domain-containing protein [Euryarchaeota archaeon]MDE2046229.1 DUF59 domain-containing protein [Thermoplasmata archaeon]